MSRATWVDYSSWKQKSKWGITEALFLIAGQEPSEDLNEFRRLFWSDKLKTFRAAIVSRTMNKEEVLSNIRKYPPETLVARLWCWWSDRSFHDYGDYGDYQGEGPYPSVTPRFFLLWCSKNHVSIPKSLRELLPEHEKKDVSRKPFIARLADAANHVLDNSYPNEGLTTKKGKPKHNFVAGQIAKRWGNLVSNFDLPKKARTIDTLARHLGNLRIDPKTQRYCLPSSSENVD